MMYNICNRNPLVCVSRLMFALQLYIIQRRVSLFCAKFRICSFIVKNLLPAKNRDELRQWLMENHRKESECWVVVKRGRSVDNGTFWYIDAVEEAM